MFNNGNKARKINQRHSDTSHIQSYEDILPRKHDERLVEGVLRETTLLTATDQHN